jgi:hypothetical protein
MITYEMVTRAMVKPPTEDLVDLYNELYDYIAGHPGCINDKNPTQKLGISGTFYVSATDIQSNYIAFVLGKRADSAFPTDVIAKFFNMPTNYKMQFAGVTGRELDGCICLIHMEERDYDLQEVYDDIY